MRYERKNALLPEEDIQSFPHDIVGPHVLVGAHEEARGHAQRQQDAHRHKCQQHKWGRLGVVRQQPLRQGHSQVERLRAVWVAVLLIVLPRDIICASEKYVCFSQRREWEGFHQQRDHIASSVGIGYPPWTG